MCYFVFIGTNKEYIQKIKLHLPYRLDLCLTSWGQEDYDLYSLTNGMCSCDYYTSKPIIEDDEVIKNKLINKYNKPKARKKGWTQEKLNDHIKKVINENNLKKIWSLGYNKI